MRQKEVKKNFQYSATVHPCIINGERVLVFEKGLQIKNPQAYANLQSFAEENKFHLKEDTRTKNKQFKFERRRAKTAPLMLLASGIFMSGLAQAGDNNNGVSATSYDAIPEVSVTALKEKATWERSYKIKSGKRFVTNPYGNVNSIMKVASEAKRLGKLKRVSTRGIKMPQEFVGGIVNRYDYKFPEECGGQKFSYYEGDGFGALGYHNGKSVILDVMVGGGPFTAPQLWGPYDQILGDKHNSSMKLMMGSGKNDGMGLLKASYAIGMTPVMAKQDFKNLGNSYVEAVNNTASCLMNDDQSSQPVIIQAKNEW